MSNFKISKKFIGAKIKKQRKLLGFTQFQLAEKVGLHEKQISRIESGLNYPTFENFVKIINSLELKMSDFEEHNISNSQLREELSFLINSSDEKELKIYKDVLTVLKNNLN